MHTPVDRATAPTGIRRLVAAVTTGRAATPAEPDQALPHRRLRAVPPPLV